MMKIIIIIIIIAIVMVITEDRAISIHDNNDSEKGRK